MPADLPDALARPLPRRMLDHEFMRLAFGAGAVVGVLAPAVGFFLVQRRMSLIGDGIGHVAFAGVALGYLLGIAPVATALVASVAGAIAVEWLRANRRTAGDQALALLFYTGIAAGVVIISAAGALNANLFSFLFGSILTVTRGGLLLVAVIGGAGLALIAVLYRALVAVALDEEGARVSGLPVGTLNVVVAGPGGRDDRALDADRRDPADRRPDGAAGDGGGTTRAQRRLDVRALDGDRARLRLRRPDDLVLRRPRPRRRDRARRRRSLCSGGDRRTSGLRGLSTVVAAGLRIRKTEPVATMRDVEKLALAMPGATRALDDEGRPSYSVHEKFFCFHRRPRPDAVDAETGERLEDVFVLRVADAEEKELILSDPRGIFFTTPHWNGYNAVLIRIPDLKHI